MRSRQLWRANSWSSGPSEWQFPKKIKCKHICTRTDTHTHAHKLCCYHSPPSDSLLSVRPGRRKCAAIPPASLQIQALGWAPEIGLRNKLQTWVGKKKIPSVQGPGTCVFSPVLCNSDRVSLWQVAKGIDGGERGLSVNERGGKKLDCWCWQIQTTLQTTPSTTDVASQDLYLAFSCQVWRLWQCVLWQYDHPNHIPEEETTISEKKTLDEVDT